MLSQKADPSYEKVAELLPPLGNPYTFLGEKEHNRRPLPRVEWDGSISGCLGFGLGEFQPWKVHSHFENANNATAQETNIRHSLLDGYLPAIQFILHDEKNQIGWEETAFARSYEECDNSLLVFIRIKLKNFRKASRKEVFSIFFTPFIRAHNNYFSIQEQTSLSVQDFYPVHDDNIEPEWLWISAENEWKKGKTYSPGTLNLDCSFEGKEEKTFYLVFAYPHYLKRGTFKKIIPQINFYRALFELKKDCDSFLAEGMTIETPEARVNNACKAALIQSFQTVVGSDVKYASAGSYSERPDLAGLPISIINAAEGFSELGFLKETKKYLSYYLRHYINERGISTYEGGAGLYDYGMLLYAVCRAYRLSGRDKAWLKENLTPVRNISRLIMKQREKSLKLNPPGSDFYGLVNSTLGDDLKSLGTAWYNYANDACCWLGLRETAKMFMEVDNTRQEGKNLLEFSEAYKKDIIASLEKSINYASKPVFIPMYPGNSKPFATFATEDRLATYCNYGFYSHLLYADLFDRDISSAIIEFREKRGGEILGASRFLPSRLDNWPLAEFGWALLNLDKVKKFLLTYYSDLAHLRMREVFTAYEQVEIAPFNDSYRTITNGQNICSNLVTPRLTKYMLIFEEREEELLWLNRAAPRDWLKNGEKIVVGNAPVRWGKISYSIESHIGKGYIGAEINPELCEKISINLRLRHPDMKKMTAVEVNGKEWKDFDIKKELIKIPDLSNKKIKIKATYR